MCVVRKKFNRDYEVPNVLSAKPPRRHSKPNIQHIPGSMSENRGNAVLVGARIERRLAS